MKLQEKDILFTRLDAETITISKAVDITVFIFIVFAEFTKGKSDFQILPIVSI